MKRRNIIITLLAVGLMIIPQSGIAGMTPLTEAQLTDVVGQAGLSAQLDKLNGHTANDSLAYGDSDALGLGNSMNAANMTLSGLGSGAGAAAGYIGLSSACTRNSAQFVTSLAVGIATAGIGLGLLGFTGLSLGLTGATMLESQSGNGKAPFSIYVSNMTTSITGKVQVSPR